MSKFQSAAGISMAAFCLCAAGRSHAATTSQLTGYVDRLDATYAVGWTCQVNNAAPLDVLISAGDRVLAVIPANLSRPDIAHICGSGGIAHGFGLRFTTDMQAVFAGEPDLAVQVYAGGVTAALLPPSSYRAANPASLPYGALASIDASGMISGVLASPPNLTPTVSLYAGAPAGQGGAFVATTTAKGGTISVSIGTQPASASPPNGNLPLYATVADASGAAIPLASPLYLPPPGLAVTTVPLTSLTAQSGARSGISNTRYTTWMPAGMSLGALSGTIALSGNNASFSEALVMVGTTTDSQATCQAENGTDTTGLPAIRRLWGGILKSNGVAAVTVPVDFALPYGLGLQGSGNGACLTTLVSAGYPFLNSVWAKYTRTAVNLVATLNPTPPQAPSMLPLGLGGEFKYDLSAGPGRTTYVGIRASRPMQIDGIAASVSAGPVAGAPALSGWQPVATGAWGIDTSFVYIPAMACATAGFIAQPSNGNFAILRQGTPIAFTLPSLNQVMMDLPLQSAATQAIQRSAYQAFTSTMAPSVAQLTLQTGDCLVAIAQSTGSAQAGLIDYENQSTAYLHLLP